MTRGDQRSATATTLRLWPWRTATRLAALVFVGWLAFSLLAGEIAAIYVASPISLALFVFFLVGCLNVLMSEGERHGDGDRRSTADVPDTAADRAWALRHPWRFGLPAAIATAITVFVARRALTLWDLDETLLSTTLDGLARGAILWVIVGLTGRFTRTTADQR